MKYIILYIGFLAMVIQPAFTQQERTGDTLTTGDVVIVKEFQPTIAAARKITSQPTPKDLKAPKIAFDYEQEEPITFESGFAPDSIRAARIKGEPLSRLYRNYLKGGFGNYLTTMGELYINSLRSRNTRWGVGLKHRASGGEVNDHPFSTFSRNRAEAYGTHFLRAHQLTGELSYDRQRMHYYGFSENFRESYPGGLSASEDLDEDIFQQTYHEIRGSASFSSFFADSSDLNYRVDVQFTHLNTQDNLDENHLVVETRMERYFNSELASLTLGLDYNSPNAVRSSFLIPAPANEEDLFITVLPQIEFSGTKWRLSAGLRAVVENRDETFFRFYPHAFFKYNVYENYIIPYAGVTGGLTRNNINSFRKTNPFVSTNAELQNTNTRYHVYGGVRGAFSSQIAFNVKASVRQEANAPLFDKQTELLQTVPGLLDRSANAFFILYDTIDITQLTAEVNFFQQERFKLDVRGDYFSYNPKNEAEAWHLPSLQLTATGRYDLRDKIVLTADLFYVSQRRARTLIASEGDEEVAAGVYAIDLDPYVDFNLGIEYRYNKKISAFLDLNNILAMEYQPWRDYQVQRFNLLFGFTYSFWGKN